MRRLEVEVIFKQLFPTSVVSSGFDDRGLVEMKTGFTNMKPNLYVQKTYNTCFVNVDSEKFYVPVDPETIQEPFKPNAVDLASKNADIPQFDLAELATRKKSGDSRLYTEMRDERALASGLSAAQVDQMVNDYTVLNP